jgi:DNA invertase Pin-like site-specific DNA recombinase
MGNCCLVCYALAQFERSLIIGRTSEGRVHAKARSVRFGRKLRLTPYQISEALARREAGNGCDPQHQRLALDHIEALASRKEAAVAGGSGYLLSGPMRLRVHRRRNDATKSEPSDGTSAEITGSSLPATGYLYQKITVQANSRHHL